MVNVVKKGVAQNVTYDPYGVYGAASITVNGRTYLIGGATEDVYALNRYRWVQYLDFYQAPAPSPAPSPSPHSKSKFHMSMTAVVILIGSSGVLALIVIGVYVKIKSDREKRNERQYLVQNAGGDVVSFGAAKIND